MDNRSTPRNQLLEYLDVIEGKTGKHLGYLGDISTTGLMFISQQQWMTGETLQVQIPLEAPLLEQLHAQEASTELRHAIDGTVEVRWSKPNLNPEFQCFGCVFSQLDPAQFGLIEEVAKYLGVDGRVTLSRAR